VSPPGVLAAAIDPSTIENAVRAATGWPGLGVIFVYSFLIAFVLPLPGEVVLCSAGYLCAEAAHLGLGVPSWLVVLLVVFSSSVGKAAGSIVALHVGYTASHSGPVLRAVRRLGFDPVEWSKRRMVELVRRYGYYGMALGLTVPGFPDTISIYVFSVIEKDHGRFAAAAFTGSVGRLAVTIAVLEGALVVA
jgi:membrane protein YqaA with SNARE-associated domain